MEKMNGLDGKTNIQEAAALKRRVKAKKIPNMIGDADDHLEKKGGGGDHHQNTKSVPFLKLFSFADSSDIFLMIVGTIGAIGNGLGLPLSTILFGQMISALQVDKDVVRVTSEICLKTLYLAAGIGAAGFLQVACWMVTGARQAARIRGVYLKTILRQDVAFFDKETNTGEVVGRMSGDTVLIQDAMGEKVGKFLQLVSTFIGGFVVAFLKGWLLTLLLLASVPLIVTSGGLMYIAISKTASRGQDAYTNAANAVEQTISSIRTVASFTGEKQAVNNYKKFLLTTYKSGVQEGFVSGLGFGLVTFVIYCCYAMAVWFGAKMVLHKGYTGGDVLNVMMSLLTGSASLGQASPCMSAFVAGKVAAYKMFETIERKPKIDAYDTKGKILDDVRGDIELRDVFFSYPTRPDLQIFSGFCLSIQSGTTAALVGQSGSGKSTVISLIERFYDPQAGKVLIDGINLKDLQLNWIRGKIGLVSQEPVLFACSIRDNIAYGKDGATTEEIRVAAELANAAKLIDALPQGLETTVGAHGTQLSGGQKQRIAIARAILKDPRILLLDEATSALDVESERIVQEALDRIMVNQTTLIVAHRLSTVRNADMIAVIHRGKIVERGSHLELIKNLDGAYSQLIRLQEVNKESGEDVDGKSIYEIPVESFGRPISPGQCKRISSQKSLSWESSTNDSSHHSFSIAEYTSTSKGPSREKVPAESEEKFPLVSIWRLAHLNKPEIPIILLGVIAAIISGMLLPILGILLTRVIHSFYEKPADLIKDTAFWSKMFLILGVVSFLAIPARAYFLSVAGCKLIERIRLMCFDKLVRMEVGWFDEQEHSSGFLGVKLSADAAATRSLVGDALGQILQVIASVVAGLIIAFITSWKLAFIVLSLIPLIGINEYLQVRYMKGFSADSKMIYEEASQVANDAVGSIRTVASFCAEDKVMHLYSRKCEGPRKAGIRQGLITGIGFGTSFVMLFLVYATSFYAGARFIEAEKATFSDVFLVFFALTFAATGVSQTSSMGPDTSKAKDAATSIFAILDQQSKIDPLDESGMTLDYLKGDIEFCNLSFKYPCRSDVQIFRDLNLAIHSSKKFQVKWLRQQMGLVSQEPVLFNDTIRANIAYGKEGNAIESEIKAVAELANAHSFISALPEGYDTIVGERGVQLSGGQKQRVAIARAMIKSPKILLLDEATSALDAESERVVQDSLDRVMVNRTTVVVAHRLSTIKNANVIAVVKDGVIVEEGEHETLIKMEDGFYASLVTLHTTSSIAS
ncbi:hypothetical protein I3842_07G128600 [Carya illinoinensis]|uniref:Uncharacterized protein n=3 Tax=Carya illinoinensis TaxID=32201 RepID=A0A922ELM5_CARIL|nr:hypothetical protein I3842_07G128600 [Carya illinoinensis]KAG6704290.1 hypothetical protein I3842_07G128600 [Carya illinoinensis]KAG6704291.1 hypothetical protein I3842_07G128600 [Carya illinoinensis]